MEAVIRNGVAHVWAQLRTQLASRVRQGVRHQAWDPLQLELPTAIDGIANRVKTLTIHQLVGKCPTVW